MSCTAPTLCDQERDVIVEFIDVGWRVVNRSVASKVMYGSKEDWYDTVPMSGDKKEFSSGRRNGIETFSVWFQNAIAFVRVAWGALKTELVQSPKWGLFEMFGRSTQGFMIRSVICDCSSLKILHWCRTMGFTLISFLSVPYTCF